MVTCSETLRVANDVVRRLLDVVLPSGCPKCQAPVNRPGALCARCWEKVQFISDPVCPRCGSPLPASPGAGPDWPCGACHRERPAFDRARAVFLYDEESRSLILDFKHGDRMELAPAFAQWLGRVGGFLLEEADIVVPVPLHWTRRLSRRYNQAAELARGLSKDAAAIYAPDVLIRKRRTASQGRRTRRGRSRNVAGAFRVAKHWEARLNGVRALLIDDVLTTGATANACAKALKNKGCDAVDLLTLARVPGPER